MNVGFYVTMIRGRRVAYLAGPFASLEEAEEQVAPACAAAGKVDPFTCFDGFGVTRIETPRELRPGVLNGRLAT